ncbi:MAG: hypothetical protein OEW83_23160, partial [Acidimicrobiia bacterium]|nr:hypothetical protein [Acidimicrobiia bacterium]
MGNQSANGGDTSANDRSGASASNGDVVDGGATIDFDDFADGDSDFFEFDGEPSTWLDGGVGSDHRGAFGEYGSAVDAPVRQGFLDRAFRERIVLVGVTVAGRTAAETD